MDARRVGRGARASARPDRGQATVEFALALPFFLLLLLAILQIALIARDEILVTHAARAAVREAGVGAPMGRVLDAAHRALPGAKVDVHWARVGEPVDVDVTYVSRTDVPLIGPLLPDFSLHARASMRAER